MTDPEFPLTFRDRVVVTEFMASEDGSEPTARTGITIGPYGVAFDDPESAHVLDGKEIVITVEVLDG